MKIRRTAIVPHTHEEWVNTYLDAGEVRAGWTPEVRDLARIELESGVPGRVDDFRSFVWFSEKSVTDTRSGR